MGLLDGIRYIVLERLLAAIPDLAWDFVVVVDEDWCVAGEYIVRVDAIGNYATSRQASPATSGWFVAPQNHNHRS
jgi:hypothetical protein